MAERRGDNRASLAGCAGPGVRCPVDGSAATSPPPRSPQIICHPVRRLKNDGDAYRRSSTIDGRCASCFGSEMLRVVLQMQMLLASAAASTPPCPSSLEPAEQWPSSLRVAAGSVVVFVAAATNWWVGARARTAHLERVGNLKLLSGLVSFGAAVDLLRLRDCGFGWHLAWLTASRCK